jgi:hypothetical protein
MQTSRKHIIVVVVAVLLLVSAPAAFASGPVSVTHDAISETVTWFMPSSQCAQLQADLSGIGERHMEKTTKVYADGSSEVLINDLVKGTASDSTGTYRFTYVNHSIETVPAGGGAHQIEMVDSFVLNGNGSAKLSVGFNWRWTYTPPAPLFSLDNLQKISTRGDPLSCDPI